MGWSIERDESGMPFQMSWYNDMIPLELAKKQAAKLIEAFSPFASRIEVAGSVRRKKVQCHDIELVMIRDPRRLFDLAALFTQPGWSIGKRNAGGKYIQFHATPYSGQLDLFFATRDNWGMQLAIRTGSAEFSHNVLAKGWSCMGYKSEGGILTSGNGATISFGEEEALFRFLGLKWPYPPEERL